MQTQVKQLTKKVKDLEVELQDAIATAEAANMGKSAVEKDWTDRLVKVRPPCKQVPTSADFFVARSPPEWYLTLIFAAERSCGRHMMLNC